MMELSHATLGAIIGQETGDPYLTFVLSVIAHLLIDKIPHFWPSSKRGKTAYVIFGYVVIFIFLIYIWLGTFQHKTAILVGAVTGVLVDTFIVGLAPLHQSILGRWHHNRQYHFANGLFIFTDLLVILISISILIIRK